MNKINCMHVWFNIFRFNIFSLYKSKVLFVLVNVLCTRKGKRKFVLLLLQVLHLYTEGINVLNQKCMFISFKIRGDILANKNVNV